MLPELLEVLEHSLMITGFVFVMMLIIEYINVRTRGIWQEKLTRNKWQQYFLSALLGIIPGCLGAFTVVTMYSHGLLSFGAIVAAMIATSGDEAFLMFASIPQTAIVITALLFGIGIVTGFIIDKLVDSEKFRFRMANNELPLHQEDTKEYQPKDSVFALWKRPSFYRIMLVAIIAILLFLVITGNIAGHEEVWIRNSLIIVISISLILVSSVQEHFLKEHLWEHVTKVHIPKIFLWVFGTLFIVHIMLDYLNVEALIADNLLVVLIVAILIGIIPESGPHFIFITLFMQGTIPFSVLLASSISQDGHGMIPLLAESKRSFFAIKTVNVVIALVVGIIGHLAGF